MQYNKQPIQYRGGGANSLDTTNTSHSNTYPIHQTTHTILTQTSTDSQHISISSSQPTQQSQSLIQPTSLQKDYDSQSKSMRESQFLDSKDKTESFNSHNTIQSVESKNTDSQTHFNPHNVFKILKLISIHTMFLTLKQRKNL